MINQNKKYLIPISIIIIFFILGYIIFIFQKIHSDCVYIICDLNTIKLVLYYCYPKLLDFDTIPIDIIVL